MSQHEQFADDLALHALGLLEGAEQTALEQHLNSCADCRAELAQYRTDSSLLALTTAGAAPPERARERLLNSLKSCPQTIVPKAINQAAASLEFIKRELPKQEFTAPLPMPIDRRRVPKPTWFGALGWAAAAAMLLSSAILLTQNSKLRQSLETAKDQQSQQKIRLHQAEQLVSILTAPDAVHSTLVSSKATPQPQGKAFYQRNVGQLVFIASNMPTLPPNKAYELWLIPDVGAPMNAGVFTTDARGNGTLVNSQLPVGITAKAFAITVEDPAGSAAPTSPILIVGAAGL